LRHNAAAGSGEFRLPYFDRSSGRVFTYLLLMVGRGLRLILPSKIVV
jgi:hypothetical protein